MAEEKKKTQFKRRKEASLKWVFLVFIIGVCIFTFARINAETLSFFGYAFKEIISELRIPLGTFSLALGLIFGFSIGYAFNRHEKNEAENKTTQYPENFEITGNTYNGICKAIAEFPTQYPDYKNRSPKLDADIRPWLKEVGIAKNDRESHVFGSIISEHFKLSSDR